MGVAALVLLGILLVFASLCAMLRLSRKIRAVLLAVGTAVTVWSLFPAPHRATEYIQFSVGNADAAALWDQDQVIVLDTGESDGVLLPLHIGGE